MGAQVLLKNFWPSVEKSVEHSVKLFYIYCLIGPPHKNLRLTMVSQACYRLATSTTASLSS